MSNEAVVFEEEGVMSDEAAMGIARRALHYKAEIDAITANAKALVDEQQRKLDTLFEEEGERIRKWITAVKPDAKSRRNLYGLLGTRKSGGSVTVVDETLALASAKELAPSAVYEKVDLKKLPPNFTAPGFDLTPEVSKLYVQPLPRGKGEGEE